MENGGKRKRAGLSLKSFKKPALNYVKKHSVGQRLKEFSSSKCQATSGLEKLKNLASQEDIELPISENRMKLVSLMPRFPNWDKMDPFPINPLMKSLTEPKNDVSGKTTEIHDLNGNTVKEVENSNYVDLPKLGIRYFSHKIKTLLITSSESDESCMETDGLKPSEIGMKLTRVAEHELAFDRSKTTDLKRKTVGTNKERKQEVTKFRPNPYSKEEEINHAYESSIQALGNVSLQKGQATKSQINLPVAKVVVDLIENAQDNFEFDLDELQFNVPSSGNKTNIGVRKTDDRSPNLGKSTFGASMNVVNLKDYNKNTGLVNVTSTSMKDKTSNVHNQTIVSNSQSKRGVSEMKDHTFVSRKPKDGEPYTDVSNTNAKRVYNKEVTVIPNTPPKRERQTAKGCRPMDCKVPRLQRNKSVRKSVEVSKLDSLCSTRETETQAGKAKSIYACKDSPKLNTMCNSSNKVQQVHANTSIRNFVNASQDIPKLNSFCKTTDKEQNVDARKSTEWSVYKNKDFKKLNSLNYRSGERQYGVECESKEKSPFASKSIPRVNSLDRKSYEESPISTSKSMERSVNEKQGLSKANSSHDMTDKEPQASKSIEKPMYADISKSSSVCTSSARKDQHVQAKNTTMKNAYNVSKGNPKLNSLFRTSCKEAHVQARKFKETSAYTSKVIPKTNSFYKTSENQRTSAKSNVDCITPKDIGGGLGSSDDLFGDDDDFDELLAKSFTDEFDYVRNGQFGNQTDSKGKWARKDDNDGSIADLIGNLDNDSDDDLLACCDEVMSPTILVREKPSSSTISGSLNKEISSKGVKRRLNIPDVQAKVRRSGDCEFSFSSGLEKSFKNDDCLKECPLCAKSFNFGFSQRDIVQHIAMCCGDEEIGKDDAFWKI